ncbi:uncharacterized protein LOC110843259 [Folsomia candida]|uniref:Uncharacterized protein n=1 Tax=Folsomia candida TaxID=158441 RepID=A0A226EPL1_FOLCA|nr:uncharacterized protein LOC110843259 [Folsomia candida]OXA58984.1 hypothetical protein Fcan01_04884 [Folsomia candida]
MDKTFILSILVWAVPCYTQLNSGNPVSNITTTVSPPVIITIATEKPVLINPDYEKKLQEYKTKIDSLQSSLARLNATLLSRIVGLETGHYNVLAERVTVVEKGATDVKHQIETIEGSIDTKVSELGQHVQGELDAMGDKMNATRSLVHSLEAGKVQRLVIQNEIWRKNFKNLNGTINRLGKARG